MDMQILRTNTCYKFVGVFKVQLRSIGRFWLVEFEFHFFHLADNLANLSIFWIQYSKAYLGIIYTNAQCTSHYFIWSYSKVWSKLYQNKFYNIGSRSNLTENVANLFNFWSNSTFILVIWPIILQNCRFCPKIYTVLKLLYKLIFIKSDI